LVTPGDGDVDFGEFFQRMKALNYAGDFNVELEYKDSTPEQNRAQLQRAAKHLRSSI
jgi:sugar phosphate isomerase/epimerase